jgi:hypothetical protein
MQDYSACADHRAFSDFRSGEGNGTNTDMRKRMHRHAAAEQDPRRKMHVVADPAVMFDDGSRVQYAILSDLGTGIDHHSRHDDGPTVKPGRLRYHGRRMDKCGGEQTMFESSLKACGPYFILPDGHQVPRAMPAL